MSIATVLSKLAAGARLSAAEAATLAEARAAATEQKMLQAMYRGYAGEPEAAAASQFFLTPQPKVADFYAAKRSQQTGRPGHVDRVLVDPEDAGEAYGHSTISLPELGFKDPMYTTARRKVSPEQIKTRERLYAQGGTVNRPMEHKRSEGQDATTQPLTGSALKALVRGWMAGTAGLPGDLEGLARAGLHMGAAPDSWFAKNVSRDPALPTSEFYKEWLPGKQQGDEVLNTLGSITGGVGATLPVKAAKGALSRVAAAAPGPLAGSLAAQRGVIKAPGGNWLAGSVEDALKGLKVEDRMRQGLNDITLKQAQNWPGLEPEASRSLALNNFVDKQLTRYIKNDMATERDPIRALAERGVLHYAPDVLPTRNLGKLRESAGFPVTNAGQSDLAKTWENVSDSSLLSPQNAGDVLRLAQEKGYDRMLNRNDWLAKVNPNTPVHEAGQQLGGQLGFDHLMDELRNAVDINSGLPAHLRLDPESLARVSVPQAVERVAKINDWRAAQKAAADQALANNAATVLHKDYPDKGFKWVELKKPEYVDPAAFANDVRIKKSLGDDPSERGKLLALADALKYEGDIMGHCVGGYCDDVASGKSRIYSLRDAKGQPHTTIEVEPGRSPIGAPEKYVKFSELTPEQMGAFDEYSKSMGNDPMHLRKLEESHLFNPESGTIVRASEVNPPPRVVQIKGKGNKKPNDEYLPFVQDFVRSGKWSDVGDLQNTGLKARSAIFDKSALEKPEISSLPEYFTQDELEAAQKAYAAKLRGEPGFADGGSVRNVINAAVGSSNLAKQVGSSADAVRSIAAGNGSLGDLNSLHQMAAQLGYTAPGLSQAMGLAATAKAGYNMATDPTGTNAAKFAAKVNPIAAQALSLYKMATDATPQDAANFIVGFHPMLRAYNGLADSFGFANIGQLAANLTKIGDPEAPAQLRDAFSNNPNSDALTRTVNDIVQRTGADPMDTLMSITGAFGTQPGYTGYYSRVGGGDTSSVSSSGRSFPSYSGGDRTDARNNGSHGSHSIGG